MAKGFTIAGGGSLTGRLRVPGDKSISHRSMMLGALADGVTVTLTECYHWSARGLFDRRHALWTAFVLETPGGVIYHIGDTGYGDGRPFRAERWNPTPQGRGRSKCSAPPDQSSSCFRCFAYSTASCCCTFGGAGS